MTNHDIESLFDLTRCQVTWEMFYFPLGLVLALIRFFIGLHTFLVACIIPKVSVTRRYILRTMCTVLGIVVKQQGLENKNEHVKVIVTNHISMLDHLAVDLVQPCILPGVWDLPKFLNWALGFKDFGVKEGRDVLIQNVKKHIQECEFPVLAHPEGATTNGKSGLLKFSTWPFSLDQPIQPVVIRATRAPFNSIALSVLGSRWWSDLLWFLFVPYTLFTLRYLPQMRPQERETPDDFCKRVQDTMAKEMGLAPTPHTCADKVEYAKRVLCVPAPAVSPTRLQSQQQPQIVQQPNPELSRMAIQVKEVLPHVPLQVIKEDLFKTRCVDATVARILEGVVSFVPEEVAPAPTTQPKFLPTKLSNPSLVAGTSSEASHPIVAAAKSFGKNADERTRSFQERKALLIENARRRYMQKHCMA